MPGAAGTGPLTATSTGADGGMQVLDELTSELELTRQSLREIEEATRGDLAP